MSAAIGKMYADSRHVSYSERDRLIVDNLGLVWTVCRRLMVMPSDDQLQNGMIGLIKAADTFDPSHEVKFQTYAWRCIWNTVAAIYKREKRRSGPVNAFTEEMFLAPVADPKAERPIDVVMDQDERRKQNEWIERVLGTMDERDRECVVEKYLGGATLEAIGARRGVTKERARQRIERGLKMARVAMRRIV